MQRSAEPSRSSRTCWPDPTTEQMQPRGDRRRGSISYKAQCKRPPMKPHRRMPERKSPAELTARGGADESISMPVTLRRVVLNLARPSRGDRDERPEAPVELIVAGGESAEVLDRTVQALDEAASFVDFAAEVADRPAGTEGNHRLRTAVGAGGGRLAKQGHSQQPRPWRGCHRAGTRPQ